MTRNLPARTELERQGYYSPPLRATSVESYYDGHPLDPYRQPTYYGEPKPDRTPIWIAAIIASVAALIIVALMFVYITTPPAPIVHHSNPSCLFWCD